MLMNGIQPVTQANKQFTDPVGSMRQAVRSTPTNKQIADLMPRNMIKAM